MKENFSMAEATTLPKTKVCNKCGRRRKVESSFGIQKRPNDRVAVKSRCQDCLAEDKRENTARRRDAARKAERAAARKAKK